MNENSPIEFPIRDLGETHHQHWAQPEPVPALLITLWPDQEPPQLQEVLGGLASAIDKEIRVGEAPDGDGPEALWARVIQLPERDEPLFLWCERAHPIPEGELGDPAAEKLPWVVGVQTLLDLHDPLADFVTLLRILAAAIPESPAILDVDAMQWHRREMLDELIDSEIEPAARILWCIHAVTAQPTAPEETSSVWLHTHGLARCGLPELEMLEVPSEHTASGAELINMVANSMLESGPPPRGQTIQLGSGMQAALYPWRDVVSNLHDASLGHARDRIDAATGEEDAHGGVRAVIGPSIEAGGISPGSLWPRDALKAFDDGTTTVFQTARATARQAALAQSTFDEMATAFAAMRADGLLGSASDQCAVLIYVPFENADDEESREHMWLEVSSIDRDRITAKLLNAPMLVTDLRLGDETVVPRESVGNWRVRIGSVGYSPDEVKAMWAAVDALRAGEGAEQ